MDYSNRATEMFDVNWANDHDLYVTTLCVARVVLRERPGASDVQLGEAVLRFYRELWGAGGWAEESPLARMKRDVGSWHAVDAGEIGESVRDSLGEEGVAEVMSPVFYPMPSYPPGPRQT